MADSSRSWPDLIGKTFEEARTVIKSDCPDVLRTAEDSMLTMDYRLDRVRVFVNKDDIVVRAPSTG